MSGITITVTTVLSLLGLGIAFYYMRKVTSVPVDMGLDEKDGERLRFIHGAIADGAMAFLKQEYKFLAIFMVVFAAIIAILIDDSHTPDYREGIYTAIAFLFGAAISIASGYIGMMVATQGNARTTVAAKKNISEAFDMAINAGAVMGFALVGLAALGLVDAFDFIIAGDDPDCAQHKPQPWPYLEAARRLGLQPAQCVAFEDSLSGIRSAQVAGLRVVGVRCAANGGCEVAPAEAATLAASPLAAGAPLRPLLALLDDFATLDRVLLGLPAAAPAAAAA